MLTIYENDLYLLSETKNAISLIYEDRSGITKLRIVRGRVYKWKKSVIKYLAKKLKVDGEIRSYNIGSRISVLIRILPEVDNKRDAYKIADLIYMMGVEEVAFWSWKINERKKDAIRSFLVMYGFK
jgi:hypothetical protein